MSERLVLGIETASSQYDAILFRGRNVIFRYLDHVAPNGLRDIREMIHCVFEKSGLSIKDIDLIAVDIGPGNQLSVRSGVAFASSLAFALRKPVCPMTSFELLAVEVSHDTMDPVLCAWKAGAGLSYVGLHQKGVAPKRVFGKLDVAVKGLTEDIARVRLAGPLQEELSGILGVERAKRTRVINPSSEVFSRIVYEPKRLLDACVEIIRPIDEESEQFR